MIKYVYCLHVKYPLLKPDFNETGIYSTDNRYSNTKFNENLSSGSRDVRYEQTDGQT